MTTEIKNSVTHEKKTNRGAGDQEQSSDKGEIKNKDVR